MQIQLPKLRKIGVDRPKKKKILLISDDIRFNSGVATAAKEIVVGTCDKYDWVQLAAALKHPDHGKVIDLSAEIEKETGIENVLVKQYCTDGYGSQDSIREILFYEKPDALMIFTDPRFFQHVFLMEHELRTEYKIPIIYLNIWDQNSPWPHWNAQAYASCDLLMCINRQTKVVNEQVLKHHGTKTTDIDKLHDLIDWWEKTENLEKGSGKWNSELDLGTLLSYVPHGSSTKYFYKQSPESKDWKEFNEFKDDFKKKHNVDFVVFFNSRNIRRKQPGDIILAFRRFCDKLTPEQAKKCCLVMKTQIADENGTDLMAVRKAICPKYKVLFNQEMLPASVMNWFYNLADCTFFMSSAEGFGLAGNESLHCGTMLIAPVTGGLQDQMRFEDENGKWIEFDENFSSNHRGKYKKCGEWAHPIFPRSRALQGSIPTPYIFDDYSDAEDAANGLFELYNLGSEERDRRGLLGQAWVNSQESGMSAGEMCKKFIQATETLFSTWKAPKRFSVKKIEERKLVENDGIVW